MGEGAGHSGPNQEFHTPNGTRPLCKAPTSSWVKAQSWLCSQAAGDSRGLSLDRAPSQFRGPGPQLSLEGFSMPGSCCRSGVPLQGPAGTKWASKSPPVALSQAFPMGEAVGLWATGPSASAGWGSQ